LQVLDIRTIRGWAADGPLGPGGTRYARSDTLRIAYEVQGAMHRRRSWLVLIQGMGFDRSGWDPVLRALRRHFRLVLVDNRGTGRSDRPDGSFTVADMAGDVAAVLTAARIDRAHVLGASLGGMVAQELAINRPERVDRLVLACTAPGWPLPYPMPAASIRLITSTRRMPPGAARRRFIENALSARTVASNPGLVERLMQVQGVRPADQGVLSAQAMAGARYAGKLGQRRIRARTLVLHGGADTVVDPRNGELLASRIAGARLVTFPDLGHLLFWEDPGGFAAAVTSFLLNPDGARPYGDGRPANAYPTPTPSELQVLLVLGVRYALPDHVPKRSSRGIIGWCCRFLLGLGEPVVSTRPVLGVEGARRKHK
jgi:pimeloyl-ACP methyl ester carboxylesterase